MMTNRDDDDAPKSFATNIEALHHLEFLKEMTASLDAGLVTGFRSPENVKQFYDAKEFMARFAQNDRHFVKIAYDKFMARLKELTDNNHSYQMLLKEIDALANPDPSCAPDVTEEYFWNNGWGGNTALIVQNIARFYVPINVNGAFKIKHTDADGNDEYQKKEDFLNIFEAKRVNITNETKTGTVVKEVTIGQLFIKERKTQYLGLTFNPDPKWKNPTIYNSWKGWPVKPIKGDVQIFLDYAHDVSFNLDDKHYEWGLAWVAQIFLEPHIIMGTAMVHRGAEGIGKSFFAETLAMLMGKHYVKITDLDQIFGQFNAHIEYALLTHFEEAFWAGDRRAEGRFKDHI